MENANNSLMNILNTIIKQAEGKDKAILEEAIKSVKEIDALEPGTNTQNKDIDNIMDAFKDKIIDIGKKE